MKKLALMAVAGMGLVLAGCNNTATVDRTSTTTSWKLSNDLRDVNTGKILRKGTRIICNNLPTTVAQRVNWEPGTRYMQLWTKGANTAPKLKDSFMLNDAQAAKSGSGYAEFTFEPGAAPLSLEGQSIVVNPKDPEPINGEIKGYTYVGVQGSFFANNSVFGAEFSNPIPVLVCNR